jgi:hypothetical protein
MAMEADYWCVFCHEEWAPWDEGNAVLYTRLYGQFQSCDVDVHVKQFALDEFYGVLYCFTGVEVSVPGTIQYDFGVAYGDEEGCVGWG